MSGNPSQLFPTLVAVGLGTVELEVVVTIVEDAKVVDLTGTGDFSVPPFESWFDGVFVVPFPRLGRFPGRHELSSENSLR